MINMKWLIAITIVIIMIIESSNGMMPSPYPSPYPAMTSGAHGRVVMPWMCLERCNEDIPPDLQQIFEYRTTLTAVSFEDYDLGPNSTLVWNEFTSVNSQIQSYNLAALPMITTVDLNKIRQLCSNSHPFIEAAVSRAKTYNYSGYNIDFEPTDTATEQDAKNFAAFLGKFANAMHGINKTLSVCVASWNDFWDFSAIASSSIDKVMTMDTYAGDFSTFTSALQKAINQIGLKKLGVGLITTVTDNSQLTQRFNLIEQSGATEIDIWDTPIPDNWWPFLQKFKEA
jgi:hypothetical protein